jgi:hypothetical protein
VGKRYAKEEIDQIRSLTEEGLSSREIAERIGRPEAGIRNLRHRMKLKTTTQQTLKTLRQDIQPLKQEKAGLLRDISSMQRRRTELSKALQADEATFQQRLTLTLSKMKDEKPALFNITLEEQIGKLAGEITVNFLNWIVS